MPETALRHSPSAVGGPALGAPAVNILSVATEIPEGRVTSAELAPQVGTDENWIVSRTGILERPWAAPGDRLDDFAARAGAKALARAGVRAEELDLVIVATITADEVTPAAAPQVARRLGADRAGAFDVSAACTGFLTGLSIAAGQIESGRANRILLIGADFCSRVVEKDDRRSTPLFADAAGAMVLGAGVRGAGPESAHDADGNWRSGQPGWVGPIVLACDGDPERALYINHEDRKFRMNGTEVFKLAVARMQEASLAALEMTGVALSEIDLFVCHQANARITRAVRERLGLSEERVVDCIARQGNSSGATLPLALAYAEEDGRLRPGTRVLLSAFGAGFTWGACVLNWGAPSSTDHTLSHTSHSSGASATTSTRV